MTTCPNCKADLTVHTNPDLSDAKIEPGSITVCMSCGHICAFDENMELRNLTDKEQLEVAGNKELLRMVEFSGFFREWLKKEKEKENEE